MVTLAVAGLFLTHGPGPGMAGRFFHDRGLDRHEIEYENRGGSGLIVERRWQLPVYSSVGMDWQGSSRGGSETAVVAAAICVELAEGSPGASVGLRWAIYAPLLETEACVCTYHNGSEAGVNRKLRCFKSHEVSIGPEEDATGLLIRHDGLAEHRSHASITRSSTLAFQLLGIMLNLHRSAVQWCPASPPQTDTESS